MTNANALAIATAEEDLLQSSNSSADGGLNAGFELDDDLHALAGSKTVLKEDSDTLDLEPEITAFEHLQERISDLTYLIADMQKESGMTQSFALEAEKLLPGFVSDETPIGFYTKTPTATRYKVALEEVTKGIWALIIAASAAVIAMIAKVYKWFTGGKEATAAAAAKAMDKDIRAAEILPEELVKASDIIKHADGLLKSAGIRIKDTSGTEFECDSFDTAIHHLFTDEERFSRAKKLLESKDPIFHDIIDNGAYSNTMLGVGKRLRAVNDAMMLKVNGIDQVILKDWGSQDNQTFAINKSTLDTLSQPISMRLQDKVMTLQEVATYLNSLKSSVQEKEVSKKILFDNLFSSMAMAYKSKIVGQVLGDLKRTLEMFNTIEKRLEKIQDVIRELASDGTPGANTADVGQHLRNVLFVASKDVVGFQLIAAQIKHYAANMEYLAKEALGFSLVIVSKVTKAMRENGQTPPPAWEKVVGDLQGRLKAITEAYYSMDD